MPVPFPPTPRERERFWQYVDKQENGCWIWMASCFTSGYGAFALRGSTRRAHRVLYVWTHGEHTEDTLDHLCRNRACVNPDHLRPASSRENVLRGTGPTAVNSAKTHCANGHEFTPKNTYVDPRTGWRQCRTCKREVVSRLLERDRDRINSRRRERRKHIIYEMKPCENCGELYQPLRSTSRFCQNRLCGNDRQLKYLARRLGR